MAIRSKAKAGDVKSVSDQDFGKLLAQARAEAGKTQGDLAAELTGIGLNVTQSTISAWEGGRQMPGVAALADVTDKLGTVLGPEAAAFLHAARLPKNAAEASGRNNGPSVSLTPQALSSDLTTVLKPADRMWAINPGSLAMISNSIIMKMWVSRVTEGSDPTNVIWPLDVCDRLSIDIARRAFGKMAGAAKVDVNGDRTMATVRHMAICRTARGRDLIANYRACGEELNVIGNFMKFEPAVSLGVEEGRLICDVNGERRENVNQKVGLHDAMNALAPFVQWNTASLLYDGDDGLLHNLFKNASERLESPGSIYREDIGLWRPRQEAFELNQAINAFETALDAILNTNTES